MQRVDLVELTGGNISQTTLPFPLQVPLELGIKVGTTEGVDEADGERGAAAADPHEGVLEGGAPGRREEGRAAVLLRQQRPVLVVFLEVLHVLINNTKELVVVEI